MLIASSLVRTGMIRQSGESVNEEFPYISFSNNPIKGSAVRVFPVRGSALYSAYDTVQFKVRSFADVQAYVSGATLYSRTRTKMTSKPSVRIGTNLHKVNAVTKALVLRPGVRIKSVYLAPINMSTLFKSLWSVFAEVWPVLKHTSKADIVDVLFKYDGYYEMYRTEDCSVLS